MAPVLKKNGQLLFNSWDSLERDRIAQVSHESLVTAFPGRAPNFLTVPFGFHDTEVIQQMVKAAGFSRVRVVRVSARGHSESARAAATGFVTGSPMLVELTETGIPAGDAIAVVERAIISVFGSGPLDVPLSAVIATARA